MRRKGYAEKEAEAILKRKKKAHREAVIMMILFGAVCVFFYWAMWTAFNSIGS